MGPMPIHIALLQIHMGPMPIHIGLLQIHIRPTSIHITRLQVRMGVMSIYITRLQTDMGPMSIDTGLVQTHSDALHASFRAVVVSGVVRQRDRRCQPTSRLSTGPPRPGSARR